MITGALLPSSSPTRLRGALARIPQPTSGDPVNVIIAMSGCSTMALPTVLPPPVTTCRYSAGRPHSSMSSEPRAMALSGVCDAGLRTTGQPAAIAGASLWATRLSGKLNGEIAPTTPIGTRIANPNLPSPAGIASRGTISPANVRASAAANWNVPTARCASSAGGADRLGGLGGDRPGKLLLALGEQAGGGVEDLGALPTWQGAGAQRLLRRRHGPIDVVGGAQRHSADLGPVERRSDDDLFAAHGGDHGLSIIGGDTVHH